MHVLVVDDEEFTRLLFQEEFEDEGWAVEVAANGYEALRVIEEATIFDKRFDVVVLDIKMPGLDGIQVLNDIKNMDPDQPVILCSAYGEFKQDFSSWVSDGYVVKSQNVEELKEVVRIVGGSKESATRTMEWTQETDRFETVNAIAVGQRDVDERRRAYTMLAQIDPERARTLLLEHGLRRQPEYLIREHVVALLGRFKPDDELFNQMIMQLQDSSWGVRIAVCTVLRKWGLSDAVAPLTVLFSDPEPRVIKVAEDAIEHLNALEIAMRDELASIEAKLTETEAK